jgi:hypothetical protein
VARALSVSVLARPSLLWMACADGMAVGTTPRSKDMHAVHRTIDLSSEYSLTRHAWERMGGRGVSPDAIGMVLNYGRAAHTRGATIYVVGRKEVRRYRQDGIDLAALEGLQVVCADNGAILTVYRNRDLRGLRPRSRRTRHSHAH